MSSLFEKMGAGTKRSSPDSERSSNSGQGRESPGRETTAVGPKEGGKEAGVPDAKRPRLVQWEPIRLPPIASVKALDVATLGFQNRKLSERLAYRQKLESGLRKRVEQLEERQTQDDALLCLINRHWNRLDEDIHLLLQRFDAETAVETETENEAPATTSFLAQLGEWEDGEADANLKNRVEFSLRATAKLVQTFDRLMQRREALAASLSAPPSSPQHPTSSPASPTPHAEASEKNEKNGLSDEVSSFNKELIAENKRLQALVSSLQQKNHNLSIKHSGFDDQVTALETKMEEKENSLEEAQFQLEKAMQREERLELRLAEVYKELEEARVAAAAGTSSELSRTGSGGATDLKNLTQVPQGRVEELEGGLEEAKELAASRLTELQELKEKSTANLIALERARMDLKNLPSKLITESTEYKSLQSAFSVLHGEAGRIREHAEGLRSQLVSAKAAHLAQIEQMEAEELLAQKQLRHEMLQLEEQLSQVRKEYEMLRLEFEQNLAANEQSGPVNREMRQLLGSCKTQIEQLKSEVARYKKKWKDSISTIAKIQKELDTERKIKERSILVEVDDDGELMEEEPAMSSEEEKEAAEELGPDGRPTPESLLRARTWLRSRVAELEKSLAELKAATASEEAEQVRLTDSLQRLRREKAALKAALARAGKTTEREERERERHFADDALKRIRHLEEQNEKLKKEAGSSKAEEAALVNEMESTGQAFDEMQEQNARLLAHLKEKDDANFKLMSERIRWNQQQKKLKEEKELMEEEVGALSNQVEAQNMVVRKLEEKERLMASQITKLESEVRMREQALDLNKRKALEFSQSSADLKLAVEKLSSQLKDASDAVAGKTTALGDQSFRICRLQEELSAAHKSLERSKKMERLGVGGADEVLLEEIKEYKSQITCPTCKVNTKNGILTKCYHVFCMDCITKRYEARRRKCPKCNQSFGANDFRRIYIF